MCDFLFVGLLWLFGFGLVSGFVFWLVLVVGFDLVLISSYVSFC